MNHCPETYEVKNNKSGFFAAVNHTYKLVMNIVSYYGNHNHKRGVVNQANELTLIIDSRYG